MIKLTCFKDLELITQPHGKGKKSEKPPFDGES